MTLFLISFWNDFNPISNLSRSKIYESSISYLNRMYSELAEVFYKNETKIELILISN